MGRLNKKVKWVRKSDIVKIQKAKKDAAYKARIASEAEAKNIAKKNKK